jgi:hypothetical protein
VVLGSAAYPPFALAGIALGVTFLIMAKDNRLRLWAVGAALVSAVVVGLALLGGVSAAQLRFAISFGGANSSSFSTPAVKLWNLVSRTSGALFGVWLIPMWLLVAIATVPLVPSRLRVWALAAIPLAAALPGALLLARGDELTFGVSAGSWLITTCAGIALPSLLAARRARRSQLLRLATLATPFTLVGYITVGYVTNSSWNRGMPAIALAPLAVALLACWATELAESGGAAAMRTGTVMALLIAGTLLSASVFGDAPLWKPHARVTSGAYAGLWAGTARVRQAEAIKQAADRWVAPGSRVTFLADPEAYLLTPGTPYTPATWLFSGRTDQAALDYFERSGALPDVVFVSDVDVKQAGGWAKAPSEDPLLATLKASYRRVGSVDGFTVFVSRGQ